MYKEITPYYQLFFGLCDECQGKSDKELYQACPPRLLRLDTILQATPMQTDGTIELVRLVVSDDHADDILIAKEEYEEIRKTLLAASAPEGKSNDSELSRLTSAIRDLTLLLRARLH